MSKTIVSVDFHSRFGFLKKPDTNEGIYLTYNCLHKPALLGILGAIAGLGGYAQSFGGGKGAQPEYLQKLGPLKLGIQPVNSSRGNFQKTVISYNNSVGYANLDGGTLMVHEQTLLDPSFRVYLLLDDSVPLETKLLQRLRDGEGEFIPYLGKNDHQLWWSDFRDYGFEEFKPEKPYSVATLLLKDRVLKDVQRSTSTRITPSSPALTRDFFMYFERLPVGFDEHIGNYQLKEFVFTNRTFPPEERFEGLYYLKDTQTVVQLL
jgi:CRISPR-associated protein Cas5h